ncbi:hypothetical protein [Janthinobacterium sp.]|uniref:hypothetical protein n=1 Tax=Janthinobacterium sp. TaxID=1871054 RepID=UPI0025C4EB6C|nr:hypothetical protein [Janthinobacterium sp.]NBV17863.1 hypothetical protein [Janthinobacterium sp.]
MDRTPALQQLTRELHAAAGQQDWNALEQLERKLAQQLPLLAGQGALSDSEHTALLTLRRVHGQALQICINEKQRLGLHMGEIHSKQEGWVAYALESDMYQDGNQA